MKRKKYNAEVEDLVALRVKAHLENDIPFDNPNEGYEWNLSQMREQVAQELERDGDLHLTMETGAGVLRSSSSAALLMAEAID